MIPYNKVVGGWMDVEKLGIDREWCCRRDEPVVRSFKYLPSLVGSIFKCRWGLGCGVGASVDLEDGSEWENDSECG